MFLCPLLEGTQYGMHATNWMYDTRMLVLDVWMWRRGDVPSLRLTDGTLVF
jgi:hypothetical protein